MNEIKNELMTIEDGINLYQQIKQKENELAVMESNFKEFKLEFIRQLEEQEIESIKKKGFIFTIVKRTTTSIDCNAAELEIEAAGKRLTDYMVLDKTRFEMDFPDSKHIKKLEGSKFLKITESKVK